MLAVHSSHYSWYKTKLSFVSVCGESGRIWYYSFKLYDQIIVRHATRVVHISQNLNHNVLSCYACQTKLMEEIPGISSHWCEVWRWWGGIYFKQECLKMTCRIGLGIIFSTICQRVSYLLTQFDRTVKLHLKNWITWGKVKKSPVLKICQTK